jgi:PAS domain S-box-containing protein
MPHPQASLGEAELQRTNNSSRQEITECQRIEEGPGIAQFWIDHSTAPAFWIGPDAQILYANHAACQSLGYSRRELLSMTVHDIDPEFPPELWADHWTKCKQLGSFTTESHHRTKNGDVFPVEMVVDFLEYKGREYHCVFARNITKRKENAQALRDSEERYRDLVEKEKDIIYALDKQGHITFANPAVEEVLGYRPDELVGKHFMAFIPPELQQETAADFERLLETGGIAAETVLLDRQGERHFVEYRSSTIEQDGKVVGSRGIVRDMTDRYRVEQALRESESKFRTLVENSYDVINLFSEEGRVLYTSPSIKRVLGYEPEERIGTYGVELLHPDDAEGSKAFFDKCLRNPRTAAQDICRLQHKDGSYRTVEVTGTNLLDEPGIHALVSIFRDVTEREQAEQAILQAKDDWEKTFDAVPELIAILDTQYRIVRVNKAMAERFGLMPEDFVGKTCHTCVHGATEPPAFCPHRKLIRDSREHTAEYHDDSLDTHFLVTVSPRFDSQGRLLGSVHVARDITEQKKSQQRALQTERLAAIGQTVTGLAHESGNALQRTQACLEMLALHVDDRPAAVDLISRIQTAQDTLHRLFRELRCYAAPVTIQREPVPVDRIIQQTWEHLELVRKDRVILLDAGDACTSRVCNVDRSAMEQVFRNILENSISAGPDPVVIEIECKEVEMEGRRALEISVRDNGPGLSPEQRTRIFEPFYTTKTHGTGLGMAISQRIVQAHGGRIEVGSSDAQGAEIVITLPSQLGRVVEEG